MSSLTRPRVRSRLAACLLATSGVVAAPVLAAPNLIIKYPGSGTNMVNGANFAVGGRVLWARHQEAAQKEGDPPTWVVDKPRVKCELWFYGSIAYLVNSTTAAMTFNGDVTTNGNFDASLMATQQGGFVSPYGVYAEALNADYEPNGDWDEVQIYIVQPPPPPGP